MVDGTDCQRIVAMASLTGIVRFVICLVDVSILVAVAFSLADALEVAAGMEEEAVATYHGARRKPLHSLIDKKKEIGSSPHHRKTADFYIHLFSHCKQIFHRDLTMHDAMV